MAIRLLNLTTEPFTFEVKQEGRDTIPPYAILSHTWAPKETDEIRFEDLEASPPRYTQKRAWRKKVRGFCHKVQSDYNYVWIDTCCINTSSSQEHTRSINSMYRWYQNAGLCLVHLADARKSKHLEWLRDPSTSRGYNFRWFTRGWTLQELLAPREVRFFDKHWHYLGTRKQFAKAIHKLTRIPLALLTGQRTIKSYEILERMDWAKGRETTEPEDEAYALCGLLEISMSAKYGSGKTLVMEYFVEKIVSKLENSRFNNIPSASLNVSHVKSAVMDIMAQKRKDQSSSRYRTGVSYDSEDLWGETENEMAKISATTNAKNLTADLGAALYVPSDNQEKDIQSAKRRRVHLSLSSSSSDDLLDTKQKKKRAPSGPLPKKSQSATETRKQRVSHPSGTSRPAYRPLNIQSDSRVNSNLGAVLYLVFLAIISVVTLIWWLIRKRPS